MTSNANLKLVQPDPNPKPDIKLLLVCGGTKHDALVPEGTTLGRFIDSIRIKHNLPESVVAKVDDFVMEDDYVLRTGEQVAVTLAEIVYGPNTYDASSFVGQKLWAAVQASRGGLNMPADDEIEAEIGGRPIKLSYPIKPGDRIEIAKTKGRKL